MQLFVRNLKGDTVPLLVQGDWKVETLKAHLQEVCGVPAAFQRLVFSGRELQDQQWLLHYGLVHGNMLSLLARLRGGKGGFGALLRGQGRDGKITTNYDACRDLSGRRLRHINADKKLEEWSRQAKERELEQVALKHLKEKAREDHAAQKREVDIGEVVQSQQLTMAGVRDAVQAGLGRVGNKRPVREPSAISRKKSRFAHVDDEEDDDLSSGDEYVNECSKVHSPKGVLPESKNGKNTNESTGVDEGSRGQRVSDNPAQLKP